MASEQGAPPETTRSAREPRDTQTGGAAAVAGWALGVVAVSLLLWIEPPAGLLAGLMGLMFVWLRRHQVPLEHAARKAHYARATPASAQGQRGPSSGR